MKDIDDKIREALRKEDSELLEHYRGEPAIYEMLMETFRGRFRWVNAIAFTWSLLMLALVIVVAYRFFQAEDVRAMVAYATAFLMGLFWMGMMKVWFWLEIQRNSITREVKRLELQVASLSRQMSDAEHRD